MNAPSDLDCACVQGWAGLVPISSCSAWWPTDHIHCVHDWTPKQDLIWDLYLLHFQWFHAYPFFFFFLFSCLNQGNPVYQHRRKSTFLLAHHWLCHVPILANMSVMRNIGVNGRILAVILSCHMSKTKLAWLLTVIKTTEFCVWTLTKWRQPIKGGTGVDLEMQAAMGKLLQYIWVYKEVSVTSAHRDKKLILY